ncbi:MAG: Ku protein, partial [Variovorax sp.]
MAARSIASLTLSFGLVSIPVRLYSATESAASVRFSMLTKDGSRVKQQYISEKTQELVPRGEMVKGYEFEKDHFVLFTPDELKALEEGSSHVVDIVAFIPLAAVDPIYYDKAYFLAPDKRGGKPYALLAEAMRKSGRCALAKWAWKAKQHVVQVRPAEDGLVLQQLLYADEVRSLADLDIEQVAVSTAELQLALQLIEQISQDSYDPAQYEDEEKKRVLAA